MTQALAWTPFAFVVFIATLPIWRHAWVMLSGLVEWEGPGGKLTIGGTTAVTILTFGALAYGFGAGAGTLTTIAKAVGVGSAPAVGAPNAPAITATVYRAQGDSLWIGGGTFVGSGSDTHDSTYIKVDSTGGGKSYHLDTLGAIERDSVGGNVAALDSGAVIDIVMKYKGASGGWSAPDTLTGVSMSNFVIVFHSDWSTDIGTTAAALGDTDKTLPWASAPAGGNGIAEVVNVSSEGLDFPTTNALKIEREVGEGGSYHPQFLESDAYYSAPDVGEWLYFRKIFRNTVPNTETSDNLQHGTQDADTFGEINVMLNDRYDAGNDVFRLEFQNGTTGGVSGGLSWPNHIFRKTLNKNQSYYIELAVHRISTTNYNLHVRISDINYTLLFEDSDFVNVNSSQSLGDTPSIPFTDVLGLTAWRVGSNGWTGTINATFTERYEAAVAIAIGNAAGQWIGEYTGGI